MTAKIIPFPIQPSPASIMLHYLWLEQVRLEILKLTGICDLMLARETFKVGIDLGRER